MNLSRRSFLGGIGAMAAVPCVFAKAKASRDPNLTVLLSDVHVNGVPGGPAYQLEKFEQMVDEILKLDPLPSRAIVFGDLAWLYGRKEDYQASLNGLKRLEAAGIPVTVGMGNHDRRSTFLEVHPSYVKRTKVPGRIVTVCDAGAVDFIMLDALQGTDDRGLSDMGPGSGRLDDAQYEWLVEELRKRTKPVFVCSHFPVSGVVCGKSSLKKLLVHSPCVAGYIHGHDHRWYVGMKFDGWHNPTIKRSLCLPSTGHWGDIGYTLFRTSGDRAVATLVQHDFYFPRPPEKGAPANPLWDAIVKDNRNQTCTFTIPGGCAKA